MEDSYEQGHQLRALAMRVAALEDNVAFLEQWCEEQQDVLDRSVGSVAYDYEVDTESESPRRTLLRVVDLRDPGDGAEDADTDTIVAVVETEHDRTVRLIRAHLNRLRTRLAASLAPTELAEGRPRPPAPPKVAGRKLSARPAGRTAP
jgi:uncharacterized coiled-coil protein SlyX